MKTTVDVDRRAVEDAAAVLGTRSLKETVNASLREVSDAGKRRELRRLVREGELPVPTPEEIARLRAPGIEPGSDGLPARRR